MARTYRHISKYEKEIIELKKKGKSNREIYEIYGLEIKQLKNFINQYNRKQEKIKAGVAIKIKGRDRLHILQCPYLKFVQFLPSAFIFHLEYVCCCLLSMICSNAY